MTKKKDKHQAIWLTGQPASGKTTLATLLISYFSKANQKYKGEIFI